jgi:hypothetical protein
MIEEKKFISLSFLFVFIFLIIGVYAQTESPALKEPSVISVEGRLSTEQHGQEEWLVLHAKDAKTYLVKGDLKEELRNKLLELGTDNLVSVTGNQDARSNVSCEQSYQYESKEKGKQELKVSTKCIRYYNLEVTQVIFAKKSDQDLPPPQRDIAEERRLTKGLGQQPLLSPIIGEIYGKITAVNLRSPIKTLEVTNLDKNSPLKNITLVVSPDTRIAKKIGQEEPMGLRPDALKVGQKVTVVYSKGELKTEALFITITGNQ